MELEHILLEEKANLAIITETWFNSDEKLKISGYDGYFSSINHRRGWGVAIYLDNCLLSKIHLVKSSSELGFDVVIIEMHIDNRHLYVCAVYRPPNLSLNDSYLMCETLSSLSGKEVLLLGTSTCRE